VTRLVTGESVLVDDSLTDYESLRVFFEVAQERGHSAPTVVVDERGVPVTHPDYADRMGTAHLKAGAWAFCRRPAAEALGLPSGTDWVRDHATSLMFYSGSPYLPKPHLHDQLYIQRFGEAIPSLLPPVCVASPVAWNNEGSRICTLETRLGHPGDTSGMAIYVLWEYEVHSGHRRRVAAFPGSRGLDFTELTYSPDDGWLHLCQWAQGRNLLIRLADGLVLTLPVVSSAMSWNPASGPNAMIAMVCDREKGLLTVYDYDLATGRLEHRSSLESPTGLPLAVRELSMAADGCSALVTAPVGVPGLDQAARGGVHVAAVINIDKPSVEPVLPVGFRTRSAQRRHTSPRWCEEPVRYQPGTVAPAEHLTASAAPVACSADPQSLHQEFLDRWIEVLEGLGAAWDSGRMPQTRFADEYVQYALSCYEIGQQATEQAVSGMRRRARSDPLARTVIRAIDTNRDHGWRPVAPLPRPEPGTPAGEPGFDSMREPDESTQQEGENTLAEVLDRLIAAGSVGQARAAGQELRQKAGAWNADDGPWQGLATASTGSLALGHYLFAAKLGLGTVLWHAFFRPELASSGLSQVPEPALLAILLNCFEACTHLPERMVIGADEQSVFDAEDTRNRCQQVLASLPAAGYLTSTPRHRAAISLPATGIPRPATAPHAGNDTPVPTAKRIFISYVREDADCVDRLASALSARGFDVWIDRTHLIPGMYWGRTIRKAIHEGDYFVACFSPRYVRKAQTYMNEELLTAIERLRLMSIDRQWFIPVKLEECKIPDLEIGPGLTLDKLHYVDFSRDWEAALENLAAALSAA
jgi:TIR domain